MAIKLSEEERTYIYKILHEHGGKEGSCFTDLEFVVNIDNGMFKLVRRYHCRETFIEDMFDAVTREHSEGYYLADDDGYLTRFLKKGALSGRGKISFYGKHEYGLSRYTKTAIVASAIPEKKLRSYCKLVEKMSLLVSATMGKPRKVGVTIGEFEYKNYNDIRKSKAAVIIDFPLALFKTPAAISLWIWVMRIAVGLIYMAERNPSPEASDIIAKIMAAKSFFDLEELIKIVSDEDCYSPFSKSYYSYTYIERHPFETFRYLVKTGNNFLSNRKRWRTSSFGFCDDLSRLDGVKAADVKKFAKELR